MRALPVAALILLSAPLAWAADAHAEFFEQRIRPVLVEHCYKCHSLQSGKDKGGLRVDSLEALLGGGGSGPAVVPGQAERSLLFAAIRQDDPDTAMPPKGDPLPPAVVEDFARWINHGAVFPAALAASRASPLEHWAYRPVRAVAPPAVADGAWPRGGIDRFLLARMEAAGIAPGPDATPAALVRRLSFALTGLPPTPAEVDAVADAAAPATALADHVERLLASPHFGERWARHWMDVVRYAEGTGNEYDYEIDGAWRYRDYLVQAFNADLPYDRFVREHIMGDLLPPRLDADGRDQSLLATIWWNLGEAASAPVDLPNDEAERMDNRIDVLGKAFNGLTLGCARCHDHKLDPISMREYYGIYGMLAHTPQVRGWANAAAFERAAERLRPLRAQAEAAATAPAVAVAALDPGEALVLGDFAAGLPDGWRLGGHAEAVDGARAPRLGLAPGLWSGTLSTRLPATLRSPTFVIAHDHIDVLAAGDGATIQVVVANYQLIRDPIYDGLKQRIAGGSGDWRWHRFAVGRWKGQRAHVEIFTGTVDGKQRLLTVADGADGRFGVRAVLLTAGAQPAAPPGARALGLVPPAPADDLRARLAAIEAAIPAPERIPAVGEQEGRDLPVHARGDAGKPRSDTAPRRWLALCGAQPAASAGSGRRELAEALLAEANPLTARVMVNRIWHHLFGRGLAPTVDNLGLLGEAPSHPELLDHLAERFVRVHRWSCKALIREIVASRAWRLASGPPPEADAANLLLSRHPLRRLEAEAVRDAILAIAGTLERGLGGPSVPVPHRFAETGTGGADYAPPSGPLDGARRRSIYLSQRRNFPSAFLDLFDRPATTGSFGRRDVSNVPTQALALLNDPFVAEQARAWAGRLRGLPSGERVAVMYREAFARPPTADEAARASAFTAERGEQGWDDLALALMNLKEFIHVR